MSSVVCLILDGAPDTSYEMLGGKTPLCAARTPNADRIAKLSTGGLMYPLGRGHIPESDTAALAFFGYAIDTEYFGRAPVEAIGLGLPFKDGDLALHLNLSEIATDRSQLRSRTVIGIANDDATLLMRAVETRCRAELGVDVSIASLERFGYRHLAVLRDPEHPLSGNISNTDPAHERRGYENYAIDPNARDVQLCRARDRSGAAQRAAALVNRFIEVAYEELDHHPINERRRSEGLAPANYLVMRSAGSRLPPRKSVRRTLGVRASILAEGPAERGVSTLTGATELSFAPAHDRPVADQYRLAARLITASLSSVDIVYAHIKGPDEPAHAGDVLAKVRAIELIDQYLIGPVWQSLDLTSESMLLSADHMTLCATRVHATDPVPYVIAPTSRPDYIDAFHEDAVASSGTGPTLNGSELFAYAVRHE